MLKPLNFPYVKPTQPQSFCSCGKNSLVFLQLEQLDAIRRRLRHDPNLQRPGRHPADVRK